MPSLNDTIRACAEDKYCCLDLSEHCTLAEFNRALLLFRQTRIEMLDIHFSDELKTDANEVGFILGLIPYLKNSKINHLDLTCNGLASQGLHGLLFLLRTLPLNITTLVLSGNNWRALNLSAVDFAKQIHSIALHTSVLFEGTDTFEDDVMRELKKLKENNKGSKHCSGLFAPSRKVVPLDNSGDRVAIDALTL